MTLPSNLVPLPAELKYVFQSIQTLERWRCKGTEGEGMETGLGATYPLWMPHPPGNSTSPSVFEHSNLALWTFREASLHLAQACLIKPLATGDQISSQALSPEVMCRTEKNLLTSPWFLLWKASYWHWTFWRLTTSLPTTLNSGCVRTQRLRPNTYFPIPSHPSTCI